MNDWTQTAAALVMNISVGAMFASLFGIDSQVMLWAMVGATIGLGFDQTEGRWRPMFLFVAASLACGLAGTALAEYLHWERTTPRNLACMALAVFFHQLLKAVADWVPALIAALQTFVIKRIGGKS